MSKKAKSKAKVYEFENGIYPRTLWVVKGGTMDEIKELFLNNEQEEINFSDKDGFGGWTCDCVRKKDYKYGVVVWFPEKITIEYMTHEATHAMLYICGACGLTIDCVDSSEHIAYLMGWICKQIDKVRTNKVNKK